jgi:hypothetical protein
MSETHYKVCFGLFLQRIILICDCLELERIDKSMCHVCYMLLLDVFDIEYTVSISV